MLDLSPFLLQLSFSQTFLSEAMHGKLRATLSFSILLRAVVWHELLLFEK